MARSGLGTVPAPSCGALQRQQAVPALRSWLRLSRGNHTLLDGTVYQQSTADVERARKHFDLLWLVSRTRGPGQQCPCCQGSGETECEWCHGTGVMTVGDKIYVNSSQGSKCPVCKAKGYVKCQFCRGTGSRARWLNPDTDPQQRQQAGGKK